MKKAILNQEVQEFLETNYHKDTAEIALKASPFPEISSLELATQLGGKKKALKKLPKWFKTRGIIYPHGLNIEQTSSQITAQYKASLIKGENLADLSAGLGIDSFYFSEKIKTVYHCEINKELSEIASHNLELLGARNINFIQQDAIEFLKSSQENFDWLYIDPSRRSENGGRVFRLVDCEPNVPLHLDLLLSRSKKLMLKTSPLLDISAGLEELGKVQEIHIIAVKNEVKELLWILTSQPSPLLIKTINFTGNSLEKFEAEIVGQEPIHIAPPQSFLYEPNAAIMKSGLFSSLATSYELGKLHPNTHLFTSIELKDFPGRRFKILEQLAYNRKKINKKIGRSKANISIRNFPESVANLRKTFKIKDGGDVYLFFTTLENERKVVLICEKITV